MTFLPRLVQRSEELSRELDIDSRCVDLKFLAFLRETSSFGVFSLGPLTIRVAMVEDLVRRRASSRAEGLSDAEEAAFDEFYALLAEQRGRRGRRGLDELDVLLALMRIRHGVPYEVFSELGVAPERVVEYVDGGDAARPELERLYSPEDAAEYLGVHVETVRSWIRSGRLRATRLAGQRALRIRASDLAHVLEPLEPAES